MILIANGKDFCKTILDKINMINGMNIYIEFSKCYKNYVKVSVERGISIRQYFERLIGKDINNTCITTCGVVSGSSTLGKDTLTSKKREILHIFEKCVMIQKI